MDNLRLDILHSFYAGVADDAALGQAIGMLAKEFDTGSISMLSLDADAPGADVVMAAGIFGSQQSMEAYRSTFAALDPAPAAFAQTRALSSTTTIELAEQGRIRQGDERTRAFLGEYYNAIGLVECLGANLSGRDGLTGLMGIHRTADRRPFSPQDVARLETYLPHVAQALALRRLMGELRQRSRGLEAVIDRMAAGVIIRDGDGQNQHVNRAALEIAARNDGLAIGRDGMPYSDTPAATQKLRRLLADIRAGSQGGLVSLPRASSRLPYTLLATPLPESAPQALRSGLREPAILIVIHDPDAKARGDAETIAAIFGLPRRTAELVAALVAGEDARDYAERRGISANAIKFHLRTAFSRTGLHRQSDLIRAAVRAMFDLGRRGGRDG